MRPHWNVNAFDQSIEGKRKRKLANKHDVAINYEVGEFQSIGYQENQFDAIALIYAHFQLIKIKLSQNIDNLPSTWWNSYF
jgi:hypothetical protein